MRVPRGELVHFRPANPTPPSSPSGPHPRLPLLTLCQSWGIFSQDSQSCCRRWAELRARDSRRGRLRQGSAAAPGQGWGTGSGYGAPPRPAWGPHGALGGEQSRVGGTVLPHAAVGVSRCPLPFRWSQGKQGVIPGGAGQRPSDTLGPEPGTPPQAAPAPCPARPAHKEVPQQLPGQLDWIHGFLEAAPSPPTSTLPSDCLRLSRLAGC